jgi:hypothetical protein
MNWSCEIIEYFKKYPNDFTSLVVISSIVNSTSPLAPPPSSLQLVVVVFNYDGIVVLVLAETYWNNEEG